MNKNKVELFCLCIKNKLVQLVNLLIYSKYISVTAKTDWLSTNVRFVLSVGSSASG